MDYATFWRLNPRLLKAFVEADRIRKREREIELFVQGRYCFDAVGIALANGFRKKGAKAIDWIEEPYRLVPLTEAEQEAMAEEERRKAIAFFNAMIPDAGGHGEEVNPNG